jgi:predicted dehydrogenase
VSKSFRYGLVGLGGYAGSMCDILEAHFDLVAVCEPDRATHATRIDRLIGRGVRYVESYDGLLASDIDGVYLPLPIDLHRSHTERACAAGKHVLCEKPAAGSVEDLDAMIAARDRAGVKIAIGFQHIYDDATIARKRAILQQGGPKLATVLACWPRDAAYYARNDWAGRIQRNGVAVLDSPANNALAHYVNLALFLLGPDERSSAIPVSVEAELYRANAIENYDTCAMRARLAPEAELMIYLTHACVETINPQLSMIDLATINEPAARVAMFRKFANWARGGDELVVTLEMARSHQLLVSAASQCAAIHQIPGEYLEVVPRGSGSVTAIKQVERVFRECASRRWLPSDLDVPWAKRGESVSLP